MRSSVMALTIWLSNVAVAFAQDPAADSRATTFRAMQGPAQESVPGGALLLAAYSVIWVFVFVFVLRIALHFAKTNRELARLSAAVEKKSASAENKG